MKKIRSYIGRSVAGSIAVVLLVIVALDFISELVDQGGKVEGNYTFSEVIIYGLLSIPSSIYDFLPLASLVGCLIGLGLLANTSELTVMRAAGVSVLQIIWAVMRPILVFIGLGIFLGEFVTPMTDQYAESRKAIALGHQSALQGQRGVWNREGNEFMHFSAVLPNGKLFGVTRLQFDDEGRLLNSTYVESAIFQGDYWFERNGMKSSLGDEQVTTEYFTTGSWQSELSPLLLDVLVLSAEDLPMKRLFSYANYLERQGQDASEYRLAFWQKALQPLATASLVMIAISFIFGPLRQVTMGFRIFTGVIVGIVFRTSQDLLGPSSLIFGFSPFVAVMLPIMLCALIGWVLLRRSI
ncbi:LPS export ABC transporter permease LptG [Saccharophagus sp. K07]|uniref:LPS export ABC transporter permease LptG n=1 Tax=Saccharophagus sp. K07 TaxID=2283636 RepID=UPI0016527FD9|nr:LPS export ABC transporter permease LptG [Saccharophagus sp. K07]MBC6904414.1 LPS export ABC transporter permease LptG [Saccharophagus sp. K07]